MLKVVFADDYLLVFDKPPGLVVTSSETQPFDYAQGKKIPSLEDILKEKYQIKIERGGIVHRLDKDTSGLLVVAKTQQVLEDLQAQFKNRTIHKEYLALVHGWVEKAGSVEAPILRNPKNREKFIALQLCKAWPCKAREAVTEYEPVRLLVMSSEFMEKIFEGFNKIQMRKLEKSNYNQFTLLSCQPLTGRTHQIRVHLKHIGFSIVGDDKYGGRKQVRLDHRWCKRQFLHAAKLEFTHPITLEKLSFESGLPSDLQQAMGILQKV